MLNYPLSKSMAKLRRQRELAASDTVELGIGPAQHGLEFSTESRFLRAAVLPRHLRTKPTKAKASRPKTA